MKQKDVDKINFMTIAFW